MADKLLILGAGSFGQTVYECAHELGKFGEVAFLDDNNPTAMGKCSEYRDFLNDYKYAFAAFGDNLLRTSWIEKLSKAGFCLPVLVHKNSYVSKSAKIGQGSIVLAQSAVGANTIIGDGCIINIGALVDHDCNIAHGVHIAPGVVIKARNTVEQCTKLDSGTVLL